MISEITTYAFCSEDISKIENYDKAIADKTQTWHCHHKAEILPCRRYSSNILKKFGLYYHQPADRLIFLTCNEHRKLHMEKRIVSLETRNKLSQAIKGKTPWNKGIKVKDDVKKKISTSIRKNSVGRHWYTNGSVNKFVRECPYGFVEGKIQIKHKHV